MNKSIRITLIFVLILFIPRIWAQESILGKTNSILRAGVYKVNITPPLNIPLGGYANRTGPATGVRDSLYTVAIVLDDSKTKVAIITLDVIQVKHNEGKQICQAIEKEVGINESNIIINASHTHGSPWLEGDFNYSKEVIKKIVRAVKVASSELDTVSIGYGEGRATFNVNRRKITKEGQCINSLNPEGVTDHRIKVLRFDRTSNLTDPKAILFHFACHPNVFRWKNTEITADFPGESKSFIERSLGKRTTALFLQGCSGDIRANLPEEGKGPDQISFGRNGNENDMRWCGWSVGADVIKTTTWLGIREQIKLRQIDNKINAISGIIKVSAKEIEADVLWPREQIANGKVQLPVKLISIGKICFVALPGEPVVEYGFKIEKELKNLGFAHVFVMGYSDGDAGYIPMKGMFEVGGYEVTESALLPSCEEEIMDGVIRLAGQLVKQGN